MKKFTIGDISKSTGVSRQTLRFYDKIGLLVPDQIDPDNHYRYYSLNQFWKMDIIQICRGLDIPLSTISRILEAQDDDEVLDLLLKHREVAIAKSQYFAGIVEEINWYSAQRERMNAEYDSEVVTVRELPQRQVLLAKNEKAEELYHLTLQELCRTALKRPNIFCRHFGFIPDPVLLRQGFFHKTCEYLYFDDEVTKTINPDYLTVLPAGRYACCVVEVNWAQKQTVDAGALLRWCKQQDVVIDQVIADEIGWHLFDYTNNRFLCELKVLLPPQQTPDTRASD